MTTPQHHDCAVALCCDRNYFHLALFMIRQIAFHNPHRKFDFVIASRDELAVPDWAKPLGILLHRSGEVPERLEVARFGGSVAPLYRLMLARELGDRYRRILYMDCDMYVEGGDFNRLLEVDLGPHPIAAVLDAPFFYNQNFRAEEFARLGWPAAPYANTGLQVIDTKAYRDQEVEHRSFEAVRKHPKAIVYSDQSLTNIALRGKFAQLAPCWNWQWSTRLPLVPMTYPVLVRHFIGPRKPDRDASGLVEARFNQSYRDFLSQYMPELLPKLAPACDPAPLPLSLVFRTVVLHLAYRKQIIASLSRHKDPYVTIV
ncbi:MAG: glycosyltransferase [Tabrizicola sp.]|nr:glycosyltransferase [Tabrizicola sp.]